jgi:hypothetical protein
MGQQTSERGTADRQAEHRRLATAGLSVREIAESTGNSKSTVARDLEGFERPAAEPTEAEIQAVIAEDPDQYGPASARLLVLQRRKDGAEARGGYDGLTPDEMVTAANHLTELQQTERGYRTIKGLDGKPTRIMGPYVPTPEREERAREIGRLRKTAARLRYPGRRVEAA